MRPSQLGDDNPAAGPSSAANPGQDGEQGLHTSASRGLVYERRNLSTREGITPRDAARSSAPAEELRPPFYTRPGDEEEGIVERDPHGRFARYDVSIGKGYFKKVRRLLA